MSPAIPPHNGTSQCPDMEPRVQTHGKEVTDARHHPEILLQPGLARIQDLSDDGHLLVRLGMLAGRRVELGDAGSTEA